MGILADIFVATPNDALRYEELVTNRGDMSAFERVKYKSFTSLEFGTLWAILENVEWNVDRHMLTDVRFGPGNESWLQRFPEPLVELLANLDDGRVSKIANAWGATEEINEPGTQMRPILADLKRLARLSRKSGKPMFLWGSL